MVYYNINVSRLHFFLHLIGLTKQSFFLFFSLIFCIISLFLCILRRGMPSDMPCQHRMPYATRCIRIYLFFKKIVPIIRANLNFCWQDHKINCTKQRQHVENEHLTLVWPWSSHIITCISTASWSGNEWLFQSLF